MGQGGNPMRTSSLAQDILAPFGAKWEIQLNGARISTVAVAAVPIDAMESIKGMSVVERLVFVSSSDGTVYAVDFNFGDEIWKKKLPEPVNSPIYDSGKVIVACQDGMIRALDAWTGNELWASKYSETGLERTENMSLVASDGVVYGAFSSKKASAYDISDGKVVWSVDLKDIVQASGVVVGDKFIFATYEPAIIAVSTSDGKELWKQSLKYPVTTSLVCDESNVYAPTAFGTVVAYEVKEGKKVWEISLKGTVPFGSCIAKDWLVIGNAQGKTINLINRKVGKIDKEIKTTGVASGIINAGNFICFVGEDSKVYVMELNSFNVITAFEFVDKNMLKLFGDPVAIAGRVFVSDGKDALYQLLPKTLLEDKTKLMDDPSENLPIDGRKLEQGTPEKNIKKQNP
jgi:outer membrane protein assembly factor BamB